MKRKLFSTIKTLYAISTTVLLAYLLVSFATFRDTFEEISVKRINIVDDQGVARIVISNKEKIPNPIIAGKEFQRQMKPAGIIFYDEKGNEVGGIALSTIDNSSGLRALAFDYANADALGFLSQDDLNGKNFRAGILINDKDLSGKPGANISRMRLMTENGNAGLIINDAKENPRIKIMVDSIGNPMIQTIDLNGNIKDILIK